jgi:hypothetical protein
VKALSKAEREVVRMKCRGRCSYCGIVLPKNWQADHMEPVRRDGYWRFGRYHHSGTMLHPERHHLDNLWPSCMLCNNNKHAYTLEQWRVILQDAHRRLAANYSTYRHAQRFGLIVERPPIVRFFFETGRVQLFTTN